MSPRFHIAWIGIGLAAALAGCQSLQTPKFLMSAKAKAQAAERETPARMAVTWADTVLSNPGQPAVRGFGGRVYLFNDRGEAIAAEGQFIVYAFDDSTQDQADRVPEKKFAFTPEQFKQHMGKSTLGPSYSIWIPWDDEVGGEQREISLLPIFTDKAGHVVAGEQSPNVLPGRRRHPEDAPAYSQARRGGDAKQVAHWDSASEAETGGSTQKSSTDFRTTTIALPKTLTQRLSQAPPQQSMQPAAQKPAPEDASQTSPVHDVGEGTGQVNKAPSAWTPPNPRRTGFVRPRTRAPLEAPTHDRGMLAPFPGGFPSGRPLPSGADQATESETNGTGNAFGPPAQGQRN